LPSFAIDIAAVAGLLAILLLLLKKQDWQIAHIKRLIMTAAVLYTSRSLDAYFSIGLLHSVSIASAALLPLMTLLLIESLMRRHAPKWLKVIIAGGSALFTVCAFLPVLIQLRPFSLSLLAFHLIAIALCLYLIFTRNKASLSTDENSTVERTGFALLLLYPLLLTDFNLGIVPIDVRMSGLGVLVGAWVLISLHNRTMNRRKMSLELLLLCGSSIFVSLLLTRYLNLDTAKTLAICAILVAFTLAAATLIGALRLKTHQGAMSSVNQGLINTASFDQYIAELNHLDIGCEILTGKALFDFDADALLAAFKNKTELSRNALLAPHECETMGQSQMRLLLERYGANWAYLVATNPLHVAVSQQRGLQEKPDANLLAAFGLSRLIAERDALKKQAEEVN